MTKPKDSSISQVRYSTAQKMHAVIIYKFGHNFQLGIQSWMKNPHVSSFMLSEQSRIIWAESTCKKGIEQST